MKAKLTPQSTIIRTAALAELARRGYTVEETITMREIARFAQDVAGERKNPNEKVADFLYRFGGVRARDSTTYKPEFRPLRIVVHPRQRDIDRDQPPMQTLHGIGVEIYPGGPGGLFNR